MIRKKGSIGREPLLVVCNICGSLDDLYYGMKLQPDRKRMCNLISKFWPDRHYYKLSLMEKIVFVVSQCYH